MRSAKSGSTIANSTDDWPRSLRSLLKKRTGSPPVWAEILSEHLRRSGLFTRSPLSARFLPTRLDVRGQVGQIVADLRDEVDDLLFQHDQNRGERDGDERQHDAVLR